MPIDLPSGQLDGGNSSTEVPMKEKVSHDKETKYSVQRRYMCPRGPGDKDKGQRQEVEEEGEGEGNQGEGEEIKDCLWIDRQMVVYKDKWGNPMFG